MWTLLEALPLIRALQPETRKFGMHLALGGGVLNKGESKKDLDLYFLPMDNGGKVEVALMLAFLESLWGTSEPIGNAEYDDVTAYTYKVKFDYAGKRIDVFVMGEKGENF